MPGVFPYLGSYGGRDVTTHRRVDHDYADGSYRVYIQNPATPIRYVEILFTSISKTKRDAIAAFFNANAHLEFYIYVWPEATAVDGTGSSTTGRHLARFVGSDVSLDITNESSCRYSTEPLQIRLLN
jgi:hypothetical protein